MPFVKVYIHFVWSTKNRTPYLKTLEIRNAMWQHIKQNASNKGIYIDSINGYIDHCHCLISLGIDQNISKIMKLIKGESAYWFNKQGYISEKFQWQEEYFAISVSESILNKVKDYIKNQEIHNQKKTFKEEYLELIEKFGFKEFYDNTN